MKRILIVLMAVALMLLMLPVAPAGATPPSDLQMTVPGFVGPFTATGSAVDDGLVCGTGEVTDLSAKAAGIKSGKGVNLQIFKEFDCDDDSGTFVMKLQVRIAKGAVTFNWTVVDGTGDYVDLHGSGKGFVVPPDTDIYDGKVHID